MVKLRAQLKKTPAACVDSKLQNTIKRLDVMISATNVTWWDYSAKVKVGMIGPTNPNGQSSCAFGSAYTDEMAATVFGNLLAARWVAVTIPGMGTSVDEAFKPNGTSIKFSGWASDAQNLNVAMDVLRSAPTAVIAWRMYNSPDIDDAPYLVSADKATKPLLRDIAALANQKYATSRGGPVKFITMVGHSYGTTVLGLASYKGQMTDVSRYFVNNVVYLGSPGVGVIANTDQNFYYLNPAGIALFVANQKYYKFAKSCYTPRKAGIYRPAGCTTSPARNVFALSASKDPVIGGWLGGLGTPPHWSQFGSNRLQVPNFVNVPGSSPESLLLNKPNHSHYYDPKFPKSLMAIASIATGRYNLEKWIVGPFGLPTNAT